MQSELDAAVALQNLLHSWVARRCSLLEIRSKLMESQFNASSGLPVLSSTLFIGALLAIGLFFFIRASVKDRTTEIELLAAAPADAIAAQLQAYFAKRAYRPVAGEGSTLTLEGFVRPSIGLAVFLSLLAACGAGCLALVWVLAYPEIGPWPFGSVVAIAPVAGLFYWRKAGRLERVVLSVEPQTATTSVATVCAHRDELIQLLAEPTLPLQPLRQE